MSEPLVSVFLPTYNQEKYIGQAIESALEQDYENIEIVIGDDHSQDGTWEIVTKYEREHPEKIVAFRNDENLGITGNCNEVLQRCSGELILFHAGDDILLPGKIEAQVSAMEETPSTVLCYHDVEVFESSTNETKSYWNSGDPKAKPVGGDSEKVARELIARGTSFMAGQSVMVRREAVPKEGYDVRVPIASDWLMWIDVCARNSGTVRYIDRVLTRYRKHDENMSALDRGNRIDRFVTLAIVEFRYPRFRDAVREYRGYMYYTEGVSNILEGDSKTGRMRLMESIRQSMYSWKLIGWWMYSWIVQVQNSVFSYLK